VHVTQRLAAAAGCPAVPKSANTDRVVGIVSAISSSVGLLTFAVAFCAGGLTDRGNRMAGEILGMGIILGIFLLFAGFVCGVIGRRTMAGCSGLVLSAFSLTLIAGLVIFGLTHRHH
jgi:vacuolar-type H+-ATPase subunit I/STV1